MIYRTFIYTLDSEGKMSVIESEDIEAVSWEEADRKAAELNSHVFCRILFTHYIGDAICTHAEERYAPSDIALLSLISDDI